MNTESGRFIDELIRRHIQPVLRERGFVRKARTWNRHRGTFIDVINVQASRWNANDSGSFTVNVGVFLPSVYSITWGKEPPSVAKVGDCIVETRLGDPSMDGETLLKVAPKGQLLEQWWNFDASTDVDVLGSQVAEVIVRQGLPFLEHFDSIEAIRDFLVERCNSPRGRPLDRINLAVIEARLGDLNSARQRLMESKRLDGWGDWASAVANRLGISLD